MILMATAEKDMPFIDAHTHITPVLDKQAIGTTVTPGIDGLIREMDKSNVSVSVLIGLPLRRDDVVRLGLPNRALDDNKAVIEAAKDHKGRIVPVFGVRLRLVKEDDGKGGTNYRYEDVEEYLKATEDALKKGLVKGLKFFLGYDDLWAKPPEGSPLPYVTKRFYELAEKYGAFVIFHTGDNYTSINPDALLKYTDPMLTGIDEVAHEFPKVDFVMAHAGNGTSDGNQIGCLVSRNQNLWVDISAWFINEWEGGLPNRLLIPPNFKRSGGKYTYVKDRKETLEIIDAWTLGKRILWATDFPLIPQNGYKNFLLDTRLTMPHIRKIAYENAQALFGVSADRL